MIGHFRGGFEGTMRDCCLFAIPETVELSSSYVARCPKPY